MVATTIPHPAPREPSDRLPTRRLGPVGRLVCVMPVACRSKDTAAQNQQFDSLRRLRDLELAKAKSI